MPSESAVERGAAYRVEWQRLEWQGSKINFFFKALESEFKICDELNQSQFTSVTLEAHTQALAMTNARIIGVEV